MTERLIFQLGTRTFMIIIKGKEIYWNDSKSKVQMLYPVPSPHAVRLGGKPTKEELDEYNLCKDEKEIMSFVIRDCTRKQARLIKRETIDE